MPDIHQLAARITLAGSVPYERSPDERSVEGVIRRTIPRNGAAPAFDGWTWTHDPARCSEVRDIRYQDGTWGVATFYPGHEVEVFESIAWSSVSISGRYQDSAPGRWVVADGPPGEDDRLELPLTADFLAARLTSERTGDVTTNPLWPVSWSIDTALILAFAYELHFDTDTDRRTGRCMLKPVKPHDFKHRDFMGAPFVSAAGNSGSADLHSWTVRDTQGMGSAGTSKATQFTVRPPCAVVVLSLTGLQPRADYEPGHVIEFTRIHPHSFVLCDLPLHLAESETKVRRPARSNMYAPPSSPADESVHAEIRPILFTDTNERRGVTWLSLGVMPGVPFWYNFFDHHEFFEGGTRAAGQKYTVVKRDAPARTIRGAIGILSGLPGAAFGYDSKNVEKVARQGAYDNLHLVPRMRAPAEVIEGNPYVAGQLSSIVQAPVCSCDCFHLHWRWGSEATKLSTLGWSEEGPNTVPGAPMVPLNQNVELQMDSDHAFTYRASAHEPRRLDWQVFFHHGMALALRVPEYMSAGVDVGIEAYRLMHAEGMLLQSPLRGLVATVGNWSVRYHYFRYRSSTTARSQAPRAG